MTEDMQIAKAETAISLLLVDDEDVIHKSLGRILERLGYDMLHARSGEEGLEIFEAQKPDLVLADIKMPGMSGLDFLRELRQRSQDTEVIIITGHGDMRMAVEAMREGAFDFFQKPVKTEELQACLQRTQRYQQVRREKDRIQQQLEALLRSEEGNSTTRQIVGESPPLSRAMSLIERVAQSDRTTVLIQGESGTGKELAARAIHTKSARADKPFVSVNCKAIPDTLIESELFGHERGAFTDASKSRKGVFELATEGTLFLDEIGDMDLSAQAKVLRALEERAIRRVGGDREIPVDVRLVSATNRDLEAAVQGGSFREDLYFRLDVFQIQLPPLRERGDDVLLLAYHFLKQLAQELRKDIIGITPSAQNLLKAYHFPGNIRELRNLIERATILCDEPYLNIHHFPSRLIQNVDPPAGTVENLPTLDLEALESEAIRKALNQSNGNQTQAAEHLGIGHHALRYRLKKYQIDV